jgi:hypothetical protein
MFINDISIRVCSYSYGLCVFKISHTFHLAVVAHQLAPRKREMDPKIILSRHCANAAWNVITNVTKNVLSPSSGGKIPSLKREAAYST